MYEDAVNVQGHVENREKPESRAQDEQQMHSNATGQALLGSADVADVDPLMSLYN